MWYFYSCVCVYKRLVNINWWNGCNVRERRKNKGREIWKRRDYKTLSRRRGEHHACTYCSIAPHPQTTCSFPLMKMILVHVVSCIVILAGEMLSVLRELLKTGNRKKRRSWCYARKHRQSSIYIYMYIYMYSELGSPVCCWALMFVWLVVPCSQLSCLSSIVGKSNA